MNGIKNEAQPPLNGIWCFDVCEKEMIFSSRLRYFNSNSHRHKEQLGFVVQEIEMIKPEIN